MKEKSNNSKPVIYEITIKPGGGLKNYWRDLWLYRELFVFLAWRDILVRYKQTVIGVAWSVIRPLLTMVVFTVIFGKLANMPSAGNVPYAILVFIALLPWQFFSNALTEVSNALIANANILTKIYFPRLIVPVAAVIVNVVDFLISLLILGGLMIWYRFVPDWRIIALPAFFLLAFVVTLGFGLLLAALNVKYRDFRYVVPFIVQFGLFISPVGFSSEVVPAQWRMVYSLNPIVGVIEGFRWSILGPDAPLYLPGLLISVAVAVTLFVLGISYFRRVERDFADII